MGGGRSDWGGIGRGVWFGERASGGPSRAGMGGRGPAGRRAGERATIGRTEGGVGGGSVGGGHGCPCGWVGGRKRGASGEAGRSRDLWRNHTRICPPTTPLPPLPVSSPLVPPFSVPPLPLPPLPLPPLPLTVTHVHRVFPQPLHLGSPLCPRQLPGPLQLEDLRVDSVTPRPTARLATSGEGGGGGQGQAVDRLGVDGQSRFWGGGARGGARGGGRGGGGGGGGGACGLWRQGWGKWLRGGLT